MVLIALSLNSQAIMQLLTYEKKSAEMFHAYNWRKSHIKIQVYHFCISFNNLFAVVTFALSVLISILLFSVYSIFLINLNDPWASDEWTISRYRGFT